MTLNPYFCYLTKWSQNCMVKGSFTCRFEFFHVLFPMHVNNTATFKTRKANNISSSCCCLVRRVWWCPWWGDDCRNSDFILHFASHNLWLKNGNIDLSQYELSWVELTSVSIFIHQYRKKNLERLTTILSISLAWYHPKCLLWNQTVQFWYQVFIF